MTVEAPASPMRVIVVTACDARFFPFLTGMLDSLRSTLAAPNVSLACFDMGLDAEQRARLSQTGANLARPRPHFGIDATKHAPALLSFLARPFLPDYFPGFDVYVWLDSDIWFQQQAVFEHYVAGALTHGMAITHERERAYRFQPQLFGWTSKHFALGYGAANAAFLLTRRHLNAGFFAIRAAAPHWDAWAACYEAAIRRTGNLVPHDQFALNQALHGDRGRRSTLSVKFLDPTHNWICDRGVPMWNDEQEAFCEPYSPYRPIGALHLAGPAKRKAYRVRRTGGGSFVTCLLRGASPARPVAEPPWDRAAHAPATAA